MLPNDPKLSDSRSWRAGCMVGETWRREAASVTAERVRCSAWLGVAVLRKVLTEVISEFRVGLDSRVELL